MKMENDENVKTKATYLCLIVQDVYKGPYSHQSDTNLNNGEKWMFIKWNALCRIETLDNTHGIFL